MARKFKIGDKVKVVKFIDPGGAYGFAKNFKVGNVGKVVGYCKDDTPFSYIVERKDKQWNYFNVRELELIERKGNKHESN